MRIKQIHIISLDTKTIYAIYGMAFPLHINITIIILTNKEKLRSEIAVTFN